MATTVTSIQLRGMYLRDHQQSDQCDAPPEGIHGIGCIAFIISRSVED